ncbi:DUF1919 domain-containing protein, partial [Campylobacter lari]|nr:DUF1919 domain-containing protein [Campylobacter lari]
MISIFSNNCIAGFLYHDYNMEFLSPTINLQLSPMDFIKFCSRLDYYLSLEIKKIEIDYNVLTLFKELGGKKISFPVGKIGDLIVFFQHYKNIDEAMEKWNYRKNKIVTKKYIIMNYINYDAYPCHKDFKKIVAMFKNIPYEKKFFLHSIENLDAGDNFVYIPKVKTPWFKQVAYQHYNVKTYQIFNFPQWLNFDNFALINKQLNQ